MRSLARAALAAGAALGLAGCITPSEFHALERQVGELRQEQKKEGASGRLADLGAQMAELQEEVARLRGELEETRHLADKALEQAGAAARARAAAPSPAAAVGEPGSAPTRPISPAVAEVSDYEEAFRLYRASDYRGAIERFQSFLRAFPESEYADNAMFWVGECWFKLEDYEKAVLTFDEVARKFPKGNKVPDARYRQGLALVEIGKRTHQEAAYNAAAREIFESIVKQYPNSERVPEARRQLEKLGS